MNTGFFDLEPRALAIDLSLHVATNHACANLGTKVAGDLSHVLGEEAGFV